jgi:capsular polysaccharide biosynthesis protein
VDFWDLAKLLFRRWYIAAPLILLAAGGAYMVGKSVKPDYIATSYVQLVPPTAAEEEVEPGQKKKKDTGPKNPWLELGLTSLSRAGMLTVQDKTVLEQLDKSGLSDNVVVTFDNQSPILSIEVVGESEEQATATSSRVITMLETNIKTLQSEYGAKETSFVTTRRLDNGDNIEESNSKVKRALVAVAGVGVLLSVALTIAGDALIRRRKGGKGKGGVPGGDNPAPDGPIRGGASVEGHSLGYTPPKVITNVKAAEPAARAAVKPQAPGSDSLVGEQTAIITRPAQESDATIVLPMRTNGRKMSVGGQDSQESGRR